MNSLKKSFLVFALCFFAVFVVFAQTAEDILAEEPDLTEVEVIEHKDKLYTLRIEFMPAVNEARFIYITQSSLFDQGTAMNVIRERVESFKTERSYFKHIYALKDVTKYDKETNTAIYTSFLKFEK